MIIIDMLMSGSDGATLDGNLKPIHRSSGFAVSFTNNILETPLSESVARQTLESISVDAVINGFNEWYYGTWLDSKTSQFFLDGTVIVETMVEAVAMAHKYSQRAIFDFRSMESVYIN